MKRTFDAIETDRMEVRLQIEEATLVGIKIDNEIKLTKLRELKKGKK